MNEDHDFFSSFFLSGKPSLYGFSRETGRGEFFNRNRNNADQKMTPAGVSHYE